MAHSVLDPQQNRPAPRCRTGAVNALMVTESRSAGSVSALRTGLNPVCNILRVPANASSAEIDREGEISRLDAPPDCGAAPDASEFHDVLAGQQFRDGHGRLSSKEIHLTGPLRKLVNSAIERRADVALGKVIDVFREHSRDELGCPVCPLGTHIRHSSAKRPIEVHRQDA